MDHRQSTRAGFTLLEILVVLAVLAVVSSIGTKVWFEIEESWQVIKTRTALDQNTQAAFDTMRKDFSLVVSPSLSGIGIRGAERTMENEEEQPGMAVLVQRVPNDFIVLPVQRVRNGMLEAREVVYEIDRREQGNPKLLRLARPMGHPEALPQKTVVLAGVTGLRCEYFDGKDWQQNWEEEKAPELIRVSLTVMVPRTEDTRVDQLTEAITRVTEFPVHVS